MHVLIVGSDKVFAIENFYVKYFRKLGVEVTHFSVNTLFYDYYDRSLFNKILYRLGISGIYSLINTKFKEIVSNQKPDVIWIFKGMEIFPETLLWAKAENCKLVNYNPDNPFLFSGRGSGNKNISKSMALYDLHFIYNLEIKKELEESCEATTALLPFGFEVSEELFEMCAAQEEVMEVCFLGNPDNERAAFIDSLAGMGVPVAVYGHGWKKMITNSSVKLYDAVYGEEQWKTLRRYRVQLNLMRKHNLDSHNMRTFEVAGVGGIMVAPDTTEHRLFFENRKEAFYFKNVSDCAKIIKNLLELPKEEAEKIRMAARERSVQSGYSYKDRTLFVKEVLESLIK